MIRKIGSDIDDTALEFIPALCEFYRKEYGVSLKKKDFYTYDFWKVWNIDLSQAIQRVDAFTSSDEFKEIVPVRGAKEVFDALKQKSELSVVTARLASLAHITEYQMKKHFGDTFQERLHHGNMFHEDISQRKTKSSLCLENKIDYLIDDGLNHAIDCSKKGITVFLMDAPWNQTTDLPSNTTRVFNMDHLYSEFEKLDKRYS